MAGLVFNSFLYIFLIVKLFFEHKTGVDGLYVLPIGDALLAGMLLFARRHWEWPVAAGFLLVTLFFTAQHDVPELLHPSQVPHTVFAVLALIIPVVGIIAATLSIRQSLQPLDFK